jgi:hypothetical protein
VHSDTEVATKLILKNENFDSQKKWQTKLNAIYLITESYYTFITKQIWIYDSIRMYAHTRKKTGDIINFYNNLETQTEKVNKSEYFIEA